PPPAACPIRWRRGCRSCPPSPTREAVDALALLSSFRSGGPGPGGLVLRAEPPDPAGHAGGAGTAPRDPATARGAGGAGCRMGLSEPPRPVARPCRAELRPAGAATAERRTLWPDRRDRLSASSQP